MERPGGSAETRAAAKRVFRAALWAFVLVLALGSRAHAEPPPNEASRTLVGVDLMRFGFPSGVGVGARAFPIPQLAVEAGVGSFGLATGLEFALATLPLRHGPDRKVQPLLRVGYRKMFIHAASDRVIRGALPTNARGLSEELALEGARLDMLFVAAGFSYRFVRPVLLEISLGHLSQVGSTRAKGGREAIQLSSVRLPLGEIRATFLLPRGRRR